MKWIRRLLLAFLIFLLLALIASAVGYRRMHGMPEWYAHHSADPAAQAAAANRANQKLTATFEETARLQNSRLHPEAARLNVSRGVEPSTGAEPLRLELSDEEVNAFFDSWEKPYHWSDRYSRYLTDPEIILHDGHIILAANSTNLNTLVSIHFAPALKDGSLRMPVVSVMAGNLPLPRAFWDRYQARLLDAIQRQLPASIRAAKMNADGSANSEMVDAVMSRHLIQILNDQPTEPILFLPYTIKNRYLPVKLTDVTINENAMRLSFVPLSEDERRAMIDSLKAP